VLKNKQITKGLLKNKIALVLNATKQRHDIEKRFVTRKKMFVEEKKIIFAYFLSK